jgi:hypothetical protein
MVCTESDDAPLLQGARLRMAGDTPGFLGEKTRSVPPQRKERNAAGADAAAVECDHIYELKH